MVMIFAGVMLVVDGILVVLLPYKSYGAGVSPKPLEGWNWCTWLAQSGAIWCKPAEAGIFCFATNCVVGSSPIFGQLKTILDGKGGNHNWPSFPNNNKIWFLPDHLLLPLGLCKITFWYFWILAFLPETLHQLPNKLPIKEGNKWLKNILTAMVPHKGPFFASFSDA